MQSTTVTEDRQTSMNSSSFENLNLSNIPHVGSNNTDAQVQFLSKRIHLDALCVYFLATTPILMCILRLLPDLDLGSYYDPVVKDNSAVD
uniref:Uncharacterized protein n=1 Tax=Glossina palpalis gambiensis TaxID=67801 RepID=A0A1B0BLD6_9MUSC